MLGGGGEGKGESKINNRGGGMNEGGEEKGEGKINNKGEGTNEGGEEKGAWSQRLPWEMGLRFPPIAHINSLKIRYLSDKIHVLAEMPGGC